MLGESASPFIDEGDGLTNERERVRMLLSLITHVGRYMRSGRTPVRRAESDGSPAMS